MSQQHQTNYSPNDQAPHALAPNIPSPPTGKLSFDNDFGENPLLLAHLTKDQGMIAILSLAGAFVGAALGGLPFAAAILLSGLNDVKYAGKSEEVPEPRAIDQAPPQSLPFQPTPEPLPKSAIPQVQATVDSPSPFQKASSTGDIALQMAQIPKSTIIAASPRVGKGVVVAQAIANLKRLHPGLEVWLIDPKNEPGEQHYWAGIDSDKRCHCDLRDFDVDVDSAIDFFSAHLKNFNRSSSPSKLLIIDEFVTLSQKCSGKFANQLKDFIVGICSSGEMSPDKGLGRFIWAITQSPYVSDLGFRTKAALSTFQRVLLLNKSSLHLYPLAVSASFVPPGADSKLSRLLEKDERIYYYSRTDSWHPIPIYNLPHNSPNNLIREKLEKLLPDFREGAGSSPEVPGSSGSNYENREASEAQGEVALPVFEGWRKCFPEAPEVVEEALFFAYQQALEVEGGKRKFISQILKSGEGGRRYQAAISYLDYLSQKFGE